MARRDERCGAERRPRHAVRCPSASQPSTGGACLASSAASDAAGTRAAGSLTPGLLCFALVFLALVSTELFHGNLLRGWHAQFYTGVARSLVFDRDLIPFVAHSTTFAPVVLGASSTRPRATGGMHSNRMRAPEEGPREAPSAMVSQLLLRGIPSHGTDALPSHRHGT